MKVQIIGRKVYLMCKGKILLGDVNKDLKKNVDITQQWFSLIPQVDFPVNILNLKLKVMGLNPGYLLKSHLLYKNLLSF